MTIGEEIRAARARAGMTLRKLETETGIDHTVLSRMESGYRRVSSDELFTLAEALGVTTGDLLGRPERSEVLAVAGRLGADAHADFLVPAVERVTQVLEMADLLDRVVGPDRSPLAPQVARPAGGAARAQGRKLAEAARAAFGLGQGPAAELRQLLEERLGAMVVTQPVAGDVHGLCVRAGSTAVVMINTNDRWARQRWTAAHELAHLLMDDLAVYEVTRSGTARSASETRADAFAAHFLAPDDALRAFVAGRDLDGPGVAAVMDYFGLSMEAACNRLVDLKVLAAPAAAELRANGVRSAVSAAQLSDAFDRRAAEAEGVRIPPTRLLRRALSAYQAGRVGIGVVGAVLGEADLAALRRRLEAEDIRPPVIDSDAGALL